MDQDEGTTKLITCMAMNICMPFIYTSVGCEEIRWVSISFCLGLKNFCSVLGSTGQHKGDLSVLSLCLQKDSNQRCCKYWKKNTILERLIRIENLRKNIIVV